MRIEFPYAGATLRAWRRARNESLDYWAALLAPRFSRYCGSLSNMKTFLATFEQTDQWDTPHAEQSIFDFLKALRLTFCQGASSDESYLHDLGKIVVETMKRFYDDP